MSAIGEQLLYIISKHWPSPVHERTKNLGEDPSSEQYLMNYALYLQYLPKLRKGIPFDIHNKEILEVGCGHGGITCFLAVNGAKKVVGIDLNTRNLEIATKFANQFSFKLNCDGAKELPVEFHEMNVYDLQFTSNNFDVVLAENVFEHFTEPERALEESFRVLKPGGVLMVPIFSSIYSKHALHLKHGLKVPWANLLFSEKTICNVMCRLAEEDPTLYNKYPGLINKPSKVKDLRKYKDLNDITYGEFKRMAVRQGFAIQYFYPITSTRGLRILSWIARQMPLLRHSLLVDVFSVGACASLLKP